MAVPSSGELSLLGIRREVGSNNYNSSTNYTNISLGDLSTGDVDTINTNNDAADRPDESAPHAMSEFYAYDHDAASAGTSFSSAFGVFTMSVPEGGGAQASDLKTITVNNPSGTLTVSVTSIAANTGNLSVSVSLTGDPGTNGNGNSATGYTLEGTPITLNPIWSGSTVIRLRFRYSPHTSTTSVDQRSINFTNNSVVSSATMQVETVAAGKSDRRLKTNIERIGYSDMNIPIYLFNFKDNLNTTYKGVMAQDLLKLGFKDSVILDSDGYYSVNYNSIDVNMEKI